MEQEEFREESIHWLEEFMATVRQSLILENQYVENFCQSYLRFYNCTKNC